MKTKTLLEALLLEHINVEGAEFIGNSDGYDLFRINTWGAAEQFVNSANVAQSAGTKWTQDEDTFNGNINDTTRLYFFVNEDTNRVVVGAISSTRHNVSFENTEVIGSLNYQIENTQGNNSVPFNETVIQLLPNAEYQLVQNNNDNEPNETELEDQPAELQNEPNEVELENEPNEAEDQEHVDDDENQEHENGEEMFYCWDENGECLGEFETLEQAKNYCMKIEKAYSISTDGTYADETTVWKKPQYKTPDIKIKIINGEGVVVGYRKKHYYRFIIPETYQDYPVTTIASYALYNIDASSIECPSITKFERKAIVAPSEVKIRRDAKKYENSILPNNNIIRIIY